jgi:class 3 adenylate cyclase
MSCGAPLAVAEGESPLRELAAAMPTELATKMREPRAAGERKPITILFADIVGSTSIAEALDAEEMRRLLRTTFEAIAPVVYRYEGTIAQLLGDGLLIFFGAPVAHEDDPVRAVRCALDLLDEVRGLAPTIRGVFGVDLGMRAGINTGPVVVGEVGNDLRYEYLAVGDAVNLAARMESAADPMTVLVAGATHRLAEPLFDWIDHGEILVKGKREPIDAWQATGYATEERTPRGLAGFRVPMVGRSRELEALLHATAALATEGHGAVVTITGEPGIGKTRLVSEWRQSSGADAAPATWFVASCLSYGLRLPYHAIVDLLRAIVATEGGVHDDDIRAGLGKVVDSHLDGSTDARAALANLLSLPLEEDEVGVIRSLDPQALQARYVRTLLQLLRRLAEVRPLVILIEDVHWADPTSTLVLGRLLPLTADVPILVCLTSRIDETAPAWSLVTGGAGPDGTPSPAVALDRLAAGEEAELVRDLLAAASLTAEGIDIAERAGGNPLFAEELVRMLIEHGVGTADDVGASVRDIPDTLQGLLLARLDLLPDDAKQAARVAAVIGRRFGVRLLEEVRWT